MIKQIVNKIDWNEQFRIRQRRNASKLHEIIKLSIVLELLEKNKSNLHYIRIYTEYPIRNKLDETKICDVYFENIKTHESYAYEIQKEISKEWLEKTTEFYKNWEQLFLSTDWILVKEDDFKEVIDLEKLNKKIKEVIY